MQSTIYSEKTISNIGNYLLGIHPHFISENWSDLIEAMLNHSVKKAKTEIFGDDSFGKKETIFVWFNAICDYVYYDFGDIKVYEKMYVEVRNYLALVIEREKIGVV